MLLAKERQFKKKQAGMLASVLGRTEECLNIKPKELDKGV